MWRTRQEEVERLDLFLKLSKLQVLTNNVFFSPPIWLSVKQNHLELSIDLGYDETNAFLFFRSLAKS